METVRKPLEGVANVIRFNWPQFAGGALLAFAAAVLALWTEGAARAGAVGVAAGALIAMAASLAASWWVYDRSSLYSFDWVRRAVGRSCDEIVNINAGFDESSRGLRAAFPGANVTVLDIYDETRHTEPSIRRARARYPANSDARPADPRELPAPTGSAHLVFVFFAAHEIRNEAERIAFMKELRRILNPSGAIVLTEHLRDLPNFLAYTFGFFHFHSRRSWQRVIDAAGLSIDAELRHTPLVTSFILLPDGSTP